MTVPASLMSAFQTTRAPTTSNLESWPVIQQICFRPKRIRRVVSRDDREGTPKATEVSRNPTYRYTSRACIPTNPSDQTRAQFGSACRRKDAGYTAPPNLERSRKRNRTAACGGTPVEFAAVLRSGRVIKRDQKASASRTFAAESGCIAAHIGQLERDKVPVERLHPWPVAQKRTAELQQASNCPAHPN